MRVLLVGLLSVLVVGCALRNVVHVDGENDVEIYLRSSVEVRYLGSDDVSHYLEMTQGAFGGRPRVVVPREFLAIRGVDEGRYLAHHPVLWGIAESDGRESLTTLTFRLPRVVHNPAGTLYHRHRSPHQFSNGPDSVDD